MIRTILTYSLVATMAVGSLAACSANDKDPSAEVEQTGSITLPLEATAPSGNVYRLRAAQLYISGPENLIVSPPDDSSASFTTELSSGSYALELLPGWQLWRMSDEQPVEAELISANPVGVGIVANTETVVMFQFRAGNDVIVLGPGELTVGIAVEEVSCSSNADCAPGEECQSGQCSSLAYCGDGLIGPGEQCDDANTVTGDGCTAMCTLEFCGDGMTSWWEQCDDGNVSDWDGCSGMCTIETMCGNGVVEGAEECDDANTVTGDGCSDVCTAEICGDGVVSWWEQCDDGNFSDFDGCSSLCELEFGSACGNGLLEVELGEVCDDGNSVSGDGCDSTCTVVEVSFNCPIPGQACEQCGDGVVTPSEVCDDGNNLNGDGCSATCNVIEPGFQCPVPGALCSLCGDGIVEFAEECDDGNTDSGDGCSSSCAVE